MDAETSPTSRVVAAVPAQGATWAEIKQKTGLPSEAVDAGLLAARRAKLLVPIAGRFVPKHAVKRPADHDERDIPAMLRMALKQRTEAAAERLVFIATKTREGWTEEDFARHYGIQPERARRLMIKSGAIERSRPGTVWGKPEDWKRAAVLRAQGKTIKAVAEELGVTCKTVRTWSVKGKAL